jgi:hypothetical protein
MKGAGSRAEESQALKLRIWAGFWRFRENWMIPPGRTSSRYSAS